MTTICTDHTWKRSAYAERLLDGKGWPTGWFVVHENRRCTRCEAFQMVRVEETRARSADAALALYRETVREVTS